MSQLGLQVVNYLAKTHTSKELTKALNRFGLKVVFIKPTKSCISKNYTKVQCSDGVEVYVTNQWTYEHLDVFKIVLKKLNPPILID
jgi:dethiobiotin synthetase